MLGKGRDCSPQLSRATGHTEQQTYRACHRHETGCEFLFVDGLRQRDNGGWEDKGTKDRALGEYTSLPKLARSRLQPIFLPLEQHQHRENTAKLGGCTYDAVHLCFM